VTVFGFDLPALADTVTKTVIAVLTLIGVLLVVVGLARAWRGRRRTQVVIRDVAPVDGIPVSATAGLSPQLRQAVRRALQEETKSATTAVLETLTEDIKRGLLPGRESTTVTAIPDSLYSTTKDSLGTLSAGVRALAPKESAGLVDVLGAALPDQRGWSLTAFPTLRGAGAATQVGISLELAALGHAPDAVTTFWIDAPEIADAGPVAERNAGVRARLHELLAPASLWIAIRLVSRQLAQTTSVRRHFRGRRRQRDELAALQRQLAGQLSLYATRKLEQFCQGFTEQALEDLVEAARVLPHYFRPHSTTAAVHERQGWSYLRSEDVGRGQDAFLAAVGSYDKAEELLRADGHDERDARATLQGIAVRRTKCRLLSGNRTQIRIAETELTAFDELDDGTPQALYNVACLFAVAMGCPALPDALRARCEQRAWQYLGLSLLVGGPDGPWKGQAADVELRAMDAARRATFLDELQSRHPEMTPLDEPAARVLVEGAVSVAGPSILPAH
jgi:hypothetical protein